MSRKNSLEKNCIWIIVVCVFGIAFSNATFWLRTPVVADEMLQEEISENVDGLFIPLPGNVVFEDVKIEYDLSSISVSVPGTGKKSDGGKEEVDKNFYYDNSLKGDGKHIQELLYGYENDVNIFNIQLNELCECSAQAADGGLEITIEPIVEKYEQIVVIDPAHGGDDSGTVSFDVKESQVNFALAEAVAANMSNSSVGVFLTRKSDANPSEEERAQLIKDLKADVVLHIECRGDVKTRTKSGMEIVKGSMSLDSGSAVGQDNKNNAAGTDNYKNDIKAITCYAGYLTNKMDATNLSDEVYIAEVAAKLSETVFGELESGK